MSYVDAGYALGLSVLFLYALSLVARRRRLERRVELTVGDRDVLEGEETTGGP